jgi:hypothetical protein
MRFPLTRTTMQNEVKRFLFFFWVDGLTVRICLNFFLATQKVQMGKNGYICSCGPELLS